MGMLLIDYEKFYDRVEWGFILMTLEALGFPPTFSHMVEILMMDENAIVEVNGDRLDFFEPSISIR